VGALPQKDLHQGVKCGRQAAKGALAVSPGTREIHIHWALKPNAPFLSYDRTLKDYQAEYFRRYQILMHGESMDNH
jgi:hypothetical protein